MTKQIQKTSNKNSYSHALYELSKENNQLNEIEKQCLEILKLINNSEDLREYIKNPTLNIEEQISFINIFCEKFNLNELLKKFLSFVISKRRFFYIKDIIDDFISICSSKRGEFIAELISAKKLNDDEINIIKDDISKNFSSKIKLNYKYDSSLIGGLIIKIGSTMIDTSIKNKLNKIEKNMIEA